MRTRFILNARKHLPFAYVRSRDPRGAPPRDAVMQRLAKQMPSLNDATVSENFDTKTRSNKQSSSRSSQRLRRARNLSAITSGLHPCLTQTSDRSCSDPGNCPFVHTADDICLNQLRHGRCQAHEQGSCPWRHDIVLLESRVGTEEQRAEAFVGCHHLLGLFADALRATEVLAAAPWWERIARDHESILRVSCLDGQRCLTMKLAFFECSMSEDAECLSAHEGRTRMQQIVREIPNCADVRQLDDTADEYICLEAGVSEYIALVAECDAPPSLRDAVLFQLRFDWTSPNPSNSLKRTSRIVRTLDFLSRMHAESVRWDETGHHTFSTLFLCFHRTFVESNAVACEPLPADLGDFATTSSPSCRRHSFIECTDFWVQFLGEVASLVVRMNQTADVSNLWHLLLDVLRIIAVDVEVYFHESLRRSLPGLPKYISEDALFDPRKPLLSHTLNEYVISKLPMLRSSFSGVLLNKLCEIVGSEAGLVVGGRLIDQCRCSNRQRRLLGILDATIARLSDEASVQCQRRDDIRNGFSQRCESWISAQKDTFPSNSSGQTSLQRFEKRARERLREQLDGMEASPLDSALPLGTIGSSPMTTRLLLRSMMKQGKHHRCLRVATGLIRTSEALRKAATAPPRQLSLKSKVIRFTTWDKRKARKVLRSRTSQALVLENDNRMRGKSDELKMIRLYLGVDELAMADCLAVISHVCQSRRKLFEAVWDECRKGLVTDFSHRCLGIHRSITRSAAHDMLFCWERFVALAHNTAEPLRANRVLPEAATVSTFIQCNVSHDPRQTIHDVILVIGRHGHRCVDTSSAFTLGWLCGGHDAALGLQLLSDKSNAHSRSLLQVVGSRTSGSKTTTVAAIKSALLRDTRVAAIAPEIPRDECHTKSFERGADEAFERTRICLNASPQIALSFLCGFLQRTTEYKLQQATRILADDRSPPEIYVSCVARGCMLVKTSEDLFRLWQAVASAVIARMTPSSESNSNSSESEELSFAAASAQFEMTFKGTPTTSHSTRLAPITTSALRLISQRFSEMSTSEQASVEELAQSWCSNIKKLPTTSHTSLHS